MGNYNVTTWHGAPHLLFNFHLPPIAINPGPLSKHTRLSTIRSTRNHLSSRLRIFLLYARGMEIRSQKKKGNMGILCYTCSRIGPLDRWTRLGWTFPVGL